VGNPARTVTDSWKTPPKATSGPSSSRQLSEADCTGLNIVDSQADLDPSPFVFIFRSRTVANVDSIGSIVRRRTQCFAGPS
jgi:hypothetical protein